jgi:hypothetical protein
MRLNRQTGLYDQSVRISNPTGYAYDAIRVLIYDLPPGVRVYNASGTNNGSPYVQSLNPVPPGGSVDFTIEYYLPNQQVPEPRLVPQIVSSSAAPNPSGTFEHISRALHLASGNFLLEFNSLSNRTYYVQYTKNLIEWKTSPPALTGNGTRMQWIDNGPPKTEIPPADEPYRFYRVLLLP